MTANETKFATMLSYNNEGWVPERYRIVRETKCYLYTAPLKARDGGSKVFSGLRLEKSMGYGQTPEERVAFIERAMRTNPERYGFDLILSWPAAKAAILAGTTPVRTVAA